MSESTDKQAVKQTNSPDSLSTKQKMIQAGVISSAGFIASFVSSFMYYFFIPEEFSKDPTDAFGGAGSICTGALFIWLIWFIAFSFHSKQESWARFFSLVVGIGIVLTVILSVFVNSKDAGPWVYLLWLQIVFPILWVPGSYLQRRLKNR